MEFIDYIIDKMKLDQKEVDEHKIVWEIQHKADLSKAADRAMGVIKLKRLKMIETSQYEPTEREIDEFLRL